MINTTEYPIILCDDLPEAIESAFEAYADYVNRKYGDRELVKRYHYFHYIPIDMFCGGNLIKNNADENFLNSLLVIAIRGPKRFMEEKETLYKASRFDKTIAMGRPLGALKTAVRFALFVMWSRKQVLLPVTFRLNGCIPTKELERYGPELYRFSLSYKQDHKLYQWMSNVRLAIISTDWHVPEQLAIEEVGKFNCFLRDARNGLVGFKTQRLSPCMRHLIVEAHKHYEDRVQYKVEDIRGWDLVHNVGTSSNQYRINTNQPYRININRLDSNEIKAKMESLAFKTPKGKIDRRFFPNIGDLSFLKVIPSQETISTWSGLFEEYLSYRKEVKRIETEKCVVSALKVLSDYLGYCLPIMYFVSGNREGVIPSSPKEFTRIPFMASKGKRISGIPTFLEYVLKRRRSVATQYSILKNVHTFFEYIARSYSDDSCEDIAGPNFRNPIWAEMDLPRQEGHAKRLTNKRAFKKHVIPHLLRWVYAVEEFGMFLKEENISLPYNAETVIYTADYGFTPSYIHLGIEYKVEEIPVSIFRPKEKKSITSLSTLRMILLSLETGLRFQSSQWLCKKKWDEFNNPEDEKDVYILYVNTDKCGPPFPTPILKRVRDFLLREQLDQEMLGVPDQEILYEGRSNTRFASLVPLFRNAKTGKPYSDAWYSKVWLYLMRGFQKFYITNVGDITLVTAKKPKSDIDSVFFTVDEDPYCKVKLVPLYTPHSCRSTFINIHTQFIPLGDVADLVGHANEMVTSHYCYAHADELADKIKYADDEIMVQRGDHATIKDGPAFIKAQGANSTLAKSFNKDRNETINAFGVVSLQRVLDEKEDKKRITAIERLKASPMSQVVFRPTHICPVGEQCPEEVIKVTGAARRCGLCPLACRSVDHLPAISAKKNELLERIRSSQQAFNRLEKDGEMDALAEIWDAMEIDTQEFLAWSLTEDVLWDMSKHLKKDETQYHTIEPELVRKHLERVVKKTSQQDFVLKRIVESNEYPTMQTDRVRIFADRIRRKMLVNPEDSLGIFDDPSDSISDIASFIKTEMKTRNFTLEDLSRTLERPLSKPSLRPMIGLGLEDPKAE